MSKVQLEELAYPSVGEILYKTVLPNGLRVFLQPKSEFQETYGIITANFGSIDTNFTPLGCQSEFSYPPGIAHFLEHKLFENEDGEDLLQEFVKLGSESNAFTSFTKTSYLFSGTENIIENLTLLQELVCDAYFTEESVEREQGIIQQEIEMYQDDSDYRLFFSILSNLYPKTPLAYDIAGSKDSIADISVEDLEDNFDTFYHPSNLSLFVIGNFDLLQVFESIKETQSQFDNDKINNSYQRNSLQMHPVISTGTERLEVASPKLAVGFRGRDEIREGDRFRYKIILKLLFAMMFGWTSKRYQSFYEAGRLDSSLTLEVEVEDAFHFVILTMDTVEPVSISHHIRSAVKQFESDTDVSEEHLDIIKSEMYGETLHGFNSLEYMATQYETHLEGENLFDIPRILQEISLADVLQVGRRFLNNCDEADYLIFPK
ncbi:peptidase, M16 family [Streptococcus sp. DD10]|uniref:EF-P 5-aminopentanol modification-associated protein YfmH n=1 Tax=Streptococcus sp. DD10 TaxID=1777878 RepID=UPI0007990F89|nr:pitrilysin family protein [Streptococcus sp. DD10]KXT74266.1 peptidase, M16 family [Streptococcus sp. DD10]